MKKTEMKNENLEFYLQIQLIYIGTIRMSSKAAEAIEL
jgi:hypothetical protein